MYKHFSLLYKQAKMKPWWQCNNILPSWIFCASIYNWCSTVNKRQSTSAPFTNSIVWRIATLLEAVTLSDSGNDDDGTGVVDKGTVITVI